MWRPEAPSPLLKHQVRSLPTGYVGTTFLVRIVVAQPRAGRLFERDCVGNITEVTVGLSPRVHLHPFRHTAAHPWLCAGGQEQDLARIAPRDSL
jgi:hypothetical protein